MADRKILTHLDFLKSSEIQNVLVHKLATNPSEPVEGQIYYDTALHRLYFWNGTIWVRTDASQLEGSAGVERSGNVFKANLDSSSLEINLEKIRIAAAAAGEGLGWTAGVLGVKVSTPNLEILGDTLTINTEKIATVKKAEELIQGMDVKASCKCATTANIIILSKLLTGETLDGATLANGDRVLVKDQTNKKENGIYKVGAPPTRAEDADVTGDMSGGTFTFIEQGTVNADTGWVISSPDGTVTIGTSEITWTQFNGVGALEAGDGLTKTGNKVDFVGGSGLTVEPNLVKVDPAIVSLLAGSTPFTVVQNIDLAANGNALVVKRSGTTVTTLAVTGVLTQLISSGLLELIGQTGSTKVASTTAGTNVVLEPGSGGSINATTHKIISVVDPTEAQDAATKNYVDTSAGKKFTTNVGNGALTTIEVTHALATRDVVVEVYRNSTPWDTVDVTVERNSTEKVTLKFNTAPTSEQFRVVVKS